MQLKKFKNEIWFHKLTGPENNHGSKDAELDKMCKSKEEADYVQGELLRRYGICKIRDCIPVFLTVSNS